MAVRLDLAARGLSATATPALDVPEIERIDAALTAAILLPSRLLHPVRADRGSGTPVPLALDVGPPA